MLVRRSDIDLNTVNGQGYTPLHIAVLRKDFNLVDYIIYSRRNSISINARTKSGLSFMHIAAQEKSIKLMNTFSSLGLSYNVQDNQGKTPLMLLIHEKSPIIKPWENLMCKRELNINLKDNDGILLFLCLTMPLFIMQHKVRNLIFYHLYLEEGILMLI